MSSFSAASTSQDLGLKLSENERVLVARLLSDPTYFPIEFRTWLKNYIESSGIKVTASQIAGGTRTRTGLPPGMVVTCATVAAVPSDALACDGHPVSRTTYAALYGKIGTRFGVGDGATTFNLPDYRDRTLFGVGTAIAEGTSDGQPEASRQGPLHQHGQHTHIMGREVVSLAPGASNYSIIGNRSTHDTPTDPTQIGPAGSLQDAPNWGAVVYAVTTGQTG